MNENAIPSGPRCYRQVDKPGVVEFHYCPHYGKYTSAPGGSSCKFLGKTDAELGGESLRHLHKMCGVNVEIVG